MDEVQQNITGALEKIKQCLDQEINQRSFSKPHPKSISIRYEQFRYTSYTRNTIECRYNAITVVSILHSGKICRVITAPHCIVIILSSHALCDGVLSHIESIYRRAPLTMACLSMVCINVGQTDNTMKNTSFSNSNDIFYQIRNSMDKSSLVFQENRYNRSGIEHMNTSEPNVLAIGLRNKLELDVCGLILKFHFFRGIVRSHYLY